MTESNEDTAPTSAPRDVVAEPSNEGEKAAGAPESASTGEAPPAAEDAPAESASLTARTEAVAAEVPEEAIVAEAKSDAGAAEAFADVAATEQPGASAEAPSPDAEAAPTVEAEKAAEPEKEADPGPAPEPEPLPKPCVALIEPACVASYGGAVIKILGADFIDGCTLRIGGAEVACRRASATRLEAIVPQLPAGDVDVEVVNPDGQSDCLAGALKLAVPPAVGELSPSLGTVNGGTELVLTGFGFESGCTVHLGTVAVDVVFESDTRIRVITPPHAGEGSVDVAIKNPTGLQHRLYGAFFYKTPPPRVDTVSPASGSNAGGNILTVRGADFSEGCEVTICGLPASVEVKSSSELEVKTPAVARDGLVDLRVQNRDGQIHLAEKVFRYIAPLAPPVLTAVSPASGSVLGGLKVGLFGDDFHEECTARFGTIAAPVRFLTRKQLEVVVPASPTSGAVTVEITNPDGVTASLESAFTYEARPAPSITSVSPAFGPSTGGTKLVIEGHNFTKDSLVYIGREYPKDLVVKSATEIHAVTAPRKTAGVVDVEVGGPDVPKAILKNAFRYDAIPAPTITSVSPNRGGVGGGTEITVTGQNLLKETVILVDGKPAKYVKLVDKTTLEGKTPPGEANKMVDVVVRNPDGKEAVQKRAYLYDPRYG
jgi:IPT/TIG domain-containing protein